MSGVWCTSVDLKIWGSPLEAAKVDCRVSVSSQHVAGFPFERVPLRWWHYMDALYKPVNNLGFHRKQQKELGVKISEEPHRTCESNFGVVSPFAPRALAASGPYRDASLNCFQSMFGERAAFTEITGFGF